jgi:Rrf2 family protein
MSDALRISDAAALALHAMVFLAANPRRRLAAGEIASGLHVSEAHLSKVMQRLAKAGLVSSVRGPHGGFVLGKPANEIRLLDAFEAIEGPIELHHCLLGMTSCGAKRCILGNLVEVVNGRVRDYLAKTKLSNMSDVFRSK